MLQACMGQGNRRLLNMLPAYNMVCGSGMFPVSMLPSRTCTSVISVLQGTTVEGDLAELNTRIQATCLVPSKTAVALPVHPNGGCPQQFSHSEGLTAPFAIPEYCQLRPGSHEMRDAVHADSCGSDAQTDTMGGIRIRGSGRAAGGGCVQLVKLSGTTSVGVRA